MSIYNNFPVKYAILELKEEGGYPTNYEDIIRGYIVSKCWVVESSIKYFSNGESKILHKVIFPYKNLDNFKISLHNNRKNIGERVIPSYDFNYNPQPVDIVSELFDTYEEAKVKVEEKNEKIKHNTVLNVNYDISDPRFKQTLDKYEKEFEKQLSICRLFEELSLLNTKDMDITCDTEANKGLQLLKTKKCK